MRRTLVIVCVVLVIIGAALVARPAWQPIHLDGMDAWFTTARNQSQDPALVAAFKAQVAPYRSREAEIPAALFEAGYTRYTPELIIDVLDQDPSCHVAAHNLGRVIYAHEKNLVSSLAICGNACNEGCLHGVLMGMLGATSSSADASAVQLTPALRATIASTCTNTEILKYTGEANCYHAIGHVLSALEDDEVAPAIALCDSIYPIAAQRYFCATGVYMQRQLTQGTGQLTSGAIALCASNEYPAACYRFQLFGIFTAYNGYTNANAFCATLAGSQRLGCFNGVGADWYRILVHDPRAVNALCGSGTAADQRMCLEGALQLLNVYYPGAAARVCDAYTGDQRVCLAAAAYKNFDMRRDLTLYRVR